MSSRMPSIGVAIPVKNGWPEIRDCIEGLLAQTIRPNRIYVMDSGSTDGTREYLQGIPEVQVIPVEPIDFNHGETRNLGWQHAREDFVFYTVQDARPAEENLLAELMKGFDEDPSIMAVCGQQVTPHDPDKNPVEWFRPVSTPRATVYRCTSPAEFDALPPPEKKIRCSWDDVVALYRREALAQTPFRRVVFGEDMLWAKDALRKGYGIMYRPSARVYHYHLEDADFSFKRAFTTMYFRYRNFGFLPEKPLMSFRRKLSIVRSLVSSLGFAPARWVHWYRYNQTIHRSIDRAYTLFTQQLAQGETALDQAHETYCGTPHTLKKTHEGRLAIGERADDGL